MGRRGPEAAFRPAVLAIHANGDRRESLLDSNRAGNHAALADFELERFLHLYALNRGVLLTPFHNMALMCPDTTEADIDLHTKIFAEAAHQLTA